MRKFFITFLAYICLIGCSEAILNDIQSDEYLNIKLAVNSYNSTTTIENSKIKSLNAFLFSNNNTLNKVYSNLSTNSSQLEFPIKHYADASLYLIANIESVSSGILKYITTDEADYTSANPEKDLIFSTGKRINLSNIPLGGKLTLGENSHNTGINLTYAMARIDLQIEENNIEIDSICFKNLSTGGYLVEPQTPQTSYVGELFDHTEIFTTPLISSQTIGYTNQQYNNNNIEAKIYGRFNGIKVAIPTPLPSNIKCNTIYTIRLVKVGTTLTATISISDWEDGGTTDSTPDVDAKVLIDTSQSVFDTGVSCSSSRDTLFVPSSRNSDIILAFDTQYELEATIAGNTTDLSLESTGFNRFRLQVKGQLAGSPTYYSYIKFRNKFFEDSYGERIVVCVAPNKDYLIADISTLALVPGINVVDGLATVSQYGSKDITIPANKIQVATDVFASIQYLEDISTIGAEYKAIKLDRNSNDLIIQSVANTTGHSQAATVVIQGISTEGKKISAALSITIPPVSPDDIDILNSMCTEIGGNIWMQFNTTGTYAGDVEIAKQIVALPTGITVNNIKTKFNLFGKFSNYYNTIPACPAGFRTPTSQEFCNLLGVSNTASLQLLNGIALGSVITPGGMVTTYYSFSTANQGQALVTISKDGETMYLTNGRYAVNPARNFFEFWHSGSFNVSTASTNPYNWAGRCVKDVTYKGLK